MSSSLKNLSDFSYTTIPNAESFSFGIVVAEWNAQVTAALLSGCIDALKEHGCLEKNIEVFPVPGTYELSSGANLLSIKRNFDAIICIGCVIQGETPHFDFICNAVANGITNVSIQSNIPCIFGVLTTLNLEQALDRAGGKHGNKGTEAAITAIKMAYMRSIL